MSTHSNPFIQGGWSQAGNGQSGSWQTPPPSVYGVLPSPYGNNVAAGPPTDNVVAFQFTSFNPTILNCAVVGSQSRVAFQVATDPSAPLYTLLKDIEGRSIALIEWQPQPLVEVRGLVSKQRVKDWLRMSSNRSSRTMDVRGARYTWAPVDRYICLYTTSSSSAPRMLARVLKTQVMVSLELTQEAMQLGLLEVCLTATVLLQSGRNID